MLPSALQLADGAAELLLAGAAVYATSRMLRGYWSERLADRAPSRQDKRGHLADAKTHYARAAFQNPAVLLCLLTGSLAKGILAVVKLV